MNDSGFNDPLAFSKERVGEDKRAMQILDTQFVRLRFVDALYRTHSGKKRQKSFYIYPSFESLRSGKINPVELPLIKTLADTISKYIFKDDILYAPMGIGGHVDHFIANAVLTLFPNRHFYWIDQPYILRNLEEISSKYLHSFTVVSTERKIFALLQYISQIPLLYPEGIRLMEEQFFVDRG